MLPLDRLNNSRNSLGRNRLSTSLSSQLLIESRRKKNLTTTALLSSNLTIPSSSSTSTIQQQQSSFEEAYSPKTGIKIAVLLGGMLTLVTVSLLWKARSRFCRSRKRSASSGQARPSRISGAKFDLDYWLIQVDLLEAKEAERNRECLSPYLELPQEAPRDNQMATASWIGDAWRQWRLVQYRQQHRLLRSSMGGRAEANPEPYRRRRQLVRRFFRRLLLPSHQHPAYLIEQSPSLIAEMRPSIVNNQLIPPPETLDVQPRRVASWPRIKGAQHENGTKLSALQTLKTRQRLLTKPSKSATSNL